MEPARAAARKAQGGAGSAFGPLLRQWRARRRMSQLDLAAEAEISSRHLSFIETGRAGPSREMVGLLAQVLDVPLRDRNALLTAAGYAPIFRVPRRAAPRRRRESRGEECSHRQ